MRPEQIPLSVRQGDRGSGLKPCAQMSIEGQKQGAGIVGAGPVAGHHGARAGGLPGAGQAGQSGARQCVGGA